MSRHNRRRTRNHHKPALPPTFELPFLPPLLHNPSLPFTIIPSCIFALPDMSGDRAGPRTQPDLQSSVWQRQQWEAEQLRIFGGSSGEGDEEDLCVKMITFFEGLDFIDG